MTMDGNPVIVTTRFNSDTHNNTYADYGNDSNDDCINDNDNNDNDNHNNNTILHCIPAHIQCLYLNGLGGSASYPAPFFDDIITLSPQIKVSSS
jgi:hypothetical protein